MSSIAIRTIIYIRKQNKFFMAVCTLQIIDEVNCQLSGLDVGTRRKLSDRFKYEVPGARYLPSVRLGRWDGKVSFCSLSARTYINLLSDILPIVESAGYELEIDDLRPAPIQFHFAEFSELALSKFVWPKGHVLAGKPVELRDYQVNILNGFLENPQSVQEIATGAGKTIITAALSRAVEPYGRSIVIVPNKSLVTQTEEDYKVLNLDVGVYFGDRKEYNKTHTICTWQSLNNLLKNTKNGVGDAEIGDFVDGVVCIMVDECFNGDSKVLTPTGYMPIRDIREGDRVINYSEKDKEFKVDTVIKQHKNLTISSTERMYELEFDNGTKIKVTGNHKFLTNFGWCRADELSEKHEIINKT